MDVTDALNLAILAINTIQNPDATPQEGMETLDLLGDDAITALIAMRVRLQQQSERGPVVIEQGSPAWEWIFPTDGLGREVEQGRHKISIDDRRGSEHGDVAIKINERCWSPTLKASKR